MATQFTPEMALPYWQRGDLDWHVQYEALCKLLSASALGQLAVRPSAPGATAPLPSASLDVDVAAGTFENSTGGYTSFSGATAQAMPPSATTYLWLTDAGVLTTGPAWPAAGTKVVRLAAVTTDASTVTSVADARVFLRSLG